MAHLLIIELPGGNDTDIVQAALALGHEFTFLTQDISLYTRQPAVATWVNQAVRVIESRDFDYPSVLAQVLQAHEVQPLDAVICLLDIRLIEAARLAKALGLNYLNPDSATLLRDKFNVRTRLAQAGIEQPEFALATNNAQIQQAIDALGLPILLKPSDGYGSQNILTLLTQADLQRAQSLLTQLLPMASDYGLGVMSNDRLLIERYMSGVFIGCDTLTVNGTHHLLGIHEKLMFSPPSFAIKGGCFLPNQGEWPGLEDYLKRLLNAVGFDCGAAHIEIMLTPQGPRLVEINPRLVGAKIARLVAYSLNCSVHELLIQLHLGLEPLPLPDTQRAQPAVSRWFIAENTGQFAGFTPPQWQNEGIKCTEILKKIGDTVSYPFENAQRLGYVMACCPTRQEAEHLAEKYIEDSRIEINSH